MRSSENDNLMIDKYLRNEFSESEKLAFEARIAQDKSLQEELRFKKAIQDYFIEKSFDRKMNVLKSIERKEFNSSPAKTTGIKNNSKMKRIFIYSSVAAVLLFLILINPWWSNPQNSNIEFFNNNFSAYPSSAFTRGSETEDKQNINTDAYLKYEIGDFEQSAQLLEEAAKQGDIKSYLFAGIAYLGKHEYNKSLELLNIYKSHETTTDIDIPNLYIGINFMMLQKNSESIDILKELALKNDFIGKQAKLFLNKIEK